MVVVVEEGVVEVEVEVLFLLHGEQRWQARSGNRQAR